MDSVNAPHGRFWVIKGGVGILSLNLNILNMGTHHHYAPLILGEEIEKRPLESAFHLVDRVLI